MLIDRDGHLKLSDFGLSTGFHKTHDSSYYLKFKNGDFHDTPENIDLTLSRFSLFFSICILIDGFLERNRLLLPGRKIEGRWRILLSEHQITLHLKVST